MNDECQKLKGFYFLLNHEGLKFKRIEIKNVEKVDGGYSVDGGYAFDLKVDGGYAFDLKVDGGSKWHEGYHSNMGLIENSGTPPTIKFSSDNSFNELGYSCNVWTLNSEEFAIANVKDTMARLFRDRIAEITYYSSALKNSVQETTPQVEEAINLRSR